MSERKLDDYVEVSERIQDFRREYPTGSLRGDWRMHDVGGQWLIAYRAEAWRTPDDLAPGVGCAWELVPGRTNFTRGSELQNAETSAWGRAIIAVGASDAKRGIASREEVEWRRAERDDGLPVNCDGSLSRSRTSDAEKAAAGVMTSAQRAEHTKLQAKRAESKPSERLPETPPDDPWYDVSPGEVKRQTFTASEMITKSQSSAMHAKFAALGVKERDQRLNWTRLALELPDLGSSADLTRNQAAKLLELLERRMHAGAKL